MNRIYIILVAVGLSGCSVLSSAPHLLQCPEMPLMPAKPTMSSIQMTPEGGMTMNREDAAKLGQYILDLERGYKF